MRKIVIRIDDICPDMDWDKMDRFERLLDKYSVKPLIGVVPHNRDPLLTGGENRADYADWLLRKQAEGWKIALHGCYHIYTSKSGGIFPLNDFSEFAGIDPERQKNMIKKGIRRFRELGIRSDIFMAPAHAYDRNTLRILKAAGFKYVTDGYGNEPYTYAGLTFLPIARLRKLELKGKNGISTFVVHTWEMKDKDFEEYEELFKNMREHFADYGEMLDYPPRKRGTAGMLAEYAAAKAKSMMGKIKG